MPINLAATGIDSLVGSGLGAGVGALISAIGTIGQGRKTANKMTENGGPQDILNKQLAAIVNDPRTDANGKAQATAVAYQQFLQASSQFAASQGPKAALVVQQAVFKTPGLQNTLNTLLAPLGVTSGSPQFLQYLPGITATSDTSNYNGQSNNIGGSALMGAGIGAVGGAAYGAFTGNNILQQLGFMGGGGATAGGGNISAVNAGQVNPDGTYSGDPGTVTGYPGDPGTNISGGVGASGGIIGPGTSAGGSILQRIFGGSSLGGLIPSLIGSGTSLLGGILGSNAANNAAQVQADAARAAAQLEAQAGATAMNFETGVFNTQQQNTQSALDFQKQILGSQQANTQASLDFQRQILGLQQGNTQAALGFENQILGQQQQNAAPYINAGNQALTQIAAINANPYTLPTEADLMNSPQVQAQLALGEQALAQSQRAGGTYLSGGAAKDVNAYAQQVAELGYNNLVSNQLAARSANLNPLMQVAGLGGQTIGQLNSNMGQIGGNVANIYGESNQTMGQLGGNVAGIYGASNQGMGNIAGNVGSIYGQGNQAIGQTGSTIGAIGTGTAQAVGQTQQQAAQAQASGYVGSTNAWNGAINNIGTNIMNNATIQQILQAIQQRQPATA